MKSCGQQLDCNGFRNQPFLNERGDYIVEVMHKLKGLDLVDRVPEELQTDIRKILQQEVTKAIPRK